MYEIIGKSPQQYVEGNTQVIITIAYEGHPQSVRPSHSSQTAAMSCHDYPLTSVTFLEATGQLSHECWLALRRHSY